MPRGWRSIVEGSLDPGTRLGPYEVVGLIGSGGMGEVYHGRDTRLGRDVAIKVLAPDLSGDPQALQRFQQEAQAASALNHPNIVTVYDVGLSDGMPFIVSELLEGETLRQAIDRKRLSAARAVGFIQQAAAGLAAAHEKGILHRDIKPENLFVTSSGSLKILDFGLSKLTRGTATAEQPQRSVTAPGVLLGTAGYMSPEQIRHHPIDHRADIFSLGVVLYESLAGRPPFRRPSLADTLSAILNEDPPRVSRLRAGLTDAIDEVLRACLAKEPERRYASAADLAITLRALSPLLQQRRTIRSVMRSMHWRHLAILLLLFLLTGLAVSFAPAAPDTAARPTYHRATFVRGTITSARFRPGSGEIVYDAMIYGRPRELFATTAGHGEARSLGIRGAELLGISRSGDMALSLDRRLVRGFVATGRLATLSEGRAARELLDDVQWADWAPDGRSLAIVREVRGRTRLEFPVNRVLFESSGWIGDPRFSPDGTLIAFVDHPVNADDRGRVMVTEPDGPPRALSDGWVSILGLAWSPTGDEVWFTSQDAQGAHAVRAVDLNGRARVLAHVMSRVRLLDTSRDGRVLLARDDLRLEVHGRRRGDSEERNLSWLDWSLARDISGDGAQLLFTEFGQAAGSRPGVFMRGMDGSPPVRLGTGSGLALSPDGRHVLSIWDNRLTLMPVGAGESTALANPGINYDPYGAFVPDGRRVVFSGSEPGRATRVYVQDIPDGRPAPITPEGFQLASPGAVSPNGDTLVTVGDDERLYLSSIYGGAPRPLAGAVRGEALARWERDGRAVIVFEPGRIPARVFRLAVDGRRQVLLTVAPRDPEGAIAIHRLVMAPGGEAYAYTLERHHSDLYVAGDFPDPPAMEGLPVLSRVVKFVRDAVARAGTIVGR
jgi:Tol biopolymer transport system component